MKKLKIFLLVVSTALILTSFQPTPTYVYICTGAKSERYHKVNTCKGLSNCSKQIIKIKKKKAVKKNKRTQCKIFYKNQEPTHTTVTTQ